MGTAHLAVLSSWVVLSETYVGTIRSLLASERLEKCTYLASGLDWIVTEHACIENAGAVLDFLCLSCK